VAETIVYVLETVQVEEEYREMIGGLRSNLFNREHQMLGEQGSVR
jgi:hypothetical protein